MCKDIIIFESVTIIFALFSSYPLVKDSLEEPRFLAIREPLYFQESLYIFNFVLILIFSVENICLKFGVVLYNFEID